MITLSIPSQALQSLFRAETTIDLRDLTPRNPGTEVAWLLVPVHVTQPGFAKHVAIETPTHIDFAPVATR